jgi:hypothetical protein
MTIAAIDIARGVEHLHSQGIIHRDLKALNVLLTTDGKARICDFGLSRSIEPGNAARMTMMIGTTHWMAPEILVGPGMYDEKVDVYAYAVLLWEMLTRKLPYAGMDGPQIITEVGMNDLRPQIPATCPARLRELIETCWVRDPAARPSFREILSGWAQDPVLFPGADLGRVTAYVRQVVTAQSLAGMTLEELTELLARPEVSSDEADGCFAVVRRADRSDPFFVKCACGLLRTRRASEAAALLRELPPGAIPRELARWIAALLPTGKDALNVELVVLACRNGAAAEAMFHVVHPNQTKLCLEVIARTGVGDEENRAGILHRCQHSLRTLDPTLAVATIRCMIGVGEVRALPLDRMRVFMESRNTTLRLAAYVAVLLQADAGVSIPLDLIDYCIDRGGVLNVAGSVVLGACADIQVAKHLLGRLEGDWKLGPLVAAKVLLKARRHPDLVPRVAAIARGLKTPEDGPEVAQALATLQRGI